MGFKWQRPEETLQEVFSYNVHSCADNLTEKFGSRKQHYLLPAAEFLGMSSYPHDCMLRLINETLQKYTYEQVYLHNSHKQLTSSFLTLKPPLQTSLVTGPTLQPLAHSRSSSCPRRSCLTFSQASFNRFSNCPRRTPHSRLRTIEQVHQKNTSVSRALLAALTSRLTCSPMRHSSQNQ